MEEAGKREFLPAEVRSRLDAYLDAVESALLRAGKEREIRRSISDDLEAQLLEMLAERSQGQTPSRQDIEHLLAEIDPPHAYADPSFSDTQRQRSGVASSSQAARRKKEPTRRNFMEPIFRVVLVVCGTLLVLMPAVADYLQQRRVTEIFIARTDMGNLTLSGHMGDVSRFGFWATGTLMIVVAIVLAVRRRGAREV